MVSHPLSALSEQMKNYHLGDAGFHVSYRYHDELGELIRHYNEMLDALAESTQRLARSERESAWRTMARQVAHEINNSLTPMKLTLQQLQRSKGSERFENAFDRSTSLLIEQIDNMSNIASSFSSFAKMPEVEVHQVDIAEKMHNYITLLRNQSSIIPIRYIGPAQGVMAMADSNQIIQVFTNIVRNAVQAMEGREDSDIIIIMKDVPPHQNEAKGLTINNHWVEISFSDNGPGIPKDVQDKVFVPNFTTKNTGAGLGLAISRNIVEGCGGKITFKTSEKGTIFFVYLKKK
jgi:nitrogen fixation/metabolism regulation signal transduction histidine kinase